MAQQSVSAVLAQVDALLPNGYSAEEKLRWLTQAEGFIRSGVYGLDDDVSLTEADTLMAPAPYDELYRHYVEAQIHYCNGEMSRYNNAAAMWNTGVMTLRDAVNRTGGGKVGASALRFT